MTVTETLTSGMVGKQVKLEFTSDWDNLKKTAIFTAGCITRDVVDVSDTVTIPHEILALPGRLHVGVYGYSADDTVVIPTIMVNGPRILLGADPSGDESTDPTLPVWAQLEDRIEDLENASSGGGSGSDSSHTPVKGVDYWTDADKDEITEEVNAESVNFIAEELAKRGQLRPEFANTIEECTDTSKLYVLPDGYIYAYMTKTGQLHTNLLETAVDQNGNIVNGVGYTDNMRFFGRNDSEGYVTWAETQKAMANAVTSGLIPFDPSKNTVIRICGFGLNADSDIGNLVFFDKDFKQIEQRLILRIYLNDYSDPDDKITYDYEPAFDNTVRTFTFDMNAFRAATAHYSGIIDSEAKYIAVGIRDRVLDTLTVTIDEEIGFGTKQMWMNTGHAFVPAGYEDRIINLEESSTDHERRIKSLETYGGGSVSGVDIPAYIKAEADEVMNRVIATQGNRSFNMIAMSDFHYGGVGDNKDNLIRACKAISYIKGRIHIDAIATLGDNTPFGVSSDSVFTAAHRYFKEVNEILEMTQGNGIVNLRIPGNHDRMGSQDANGNYSAVMPDNALYTYISGYNRQLKKGNVPGGWGYYDFDSYKLRVIACNSVECDNGHASRYSQYWSTEQYNWLIDTLNMTDKDDSAEWQILLLSHHRGDDYQAPTQESGEWGENGYVLPNILHAYNTGGRFTGKRENGDVIECDFNGKNSATLIGIIHGHRHDYKYSNLYLGPAGNSNTTDVLAVSTPSTSFVTNGNPDNDGNTYTSIKDTAEETAFCVYSIDLDNHVIHAIHYGNGLDRTIPY